MATKISLQGVSGRGSKGEYQEYDFFVVIDEDISEQEAVALAQKTLAEVGGKIYRKRGQDTDRISVDYVGIQTEQPMIRLQPRNERGQFVGYADLGKQLWKLEGGTGTVPRTGTGRFMSFADYAKFRGVNMITGTARQSIETTIQRATDELRQKISMTPTKQPRGGPRQASNPVRRVDSPYKQQLMEEFD